MAGYLKKYVGKYRVKAEYDQSTNDFPRLENGRLDPSFDDLYIDCRNGIQIKHASGSTLVCYIPSKGRGSNILRAIYQDYVSDKIPAPSQYQDTLVRKLIDNGILTNAEVLDFEVYFEFNAKDIDYIAKLVGAKTGGANISPFSIKNLPKTRYVIPEADVKQYRKSIAPLYSGDDNKTFNMAALNALNKQFESIITKEQKKGFDISKDKKSKGLKTKEYIHSIGKWDEYCKFLQENLRETA